MCSYLSFFKQNTFHVHLSDNLYNNVDRYSTERSMELYAAFRLWSDDSAVAGLNRRANESYTREQFDNVQTQCAQRGVTIIPEIEAPGHALVIVQWKPELGLDDLSMLNISHPETVPTMKTIWRTFLPWFHSKTVHIGADEYDSSLVSDYTRFVNEMNTFIQQESSGRQKMRIWGTFTPKNGANISKSVTYQHWDVSADEPYYDYIENGYNVLNSDDYMYLVSGWSGSFPQELALSKIFQDPYGAPFSPAMFDSSKAGDNPARDNPRILGHAAALWNDYGPNSTTVLQTYYSWRNALPALADKQWGGDITEAEYASVFDQLQAAVPAQNLDRRIPSTSDTILHYTFNESSDTVTDISGNGYDGKLNGCTISDSALHLSNGCYLETPLGSKGRDYTLSFKIKPTSGIPGTLFSGPDSTLVNGNGTISNVTLISGGNPYSLNYTLPLNVWTDVSLIGGGNTTLLRVSGSDFKFRTMEFLTKIGVNGESFVWAPIAIEAPLARIGEGFTGLIKDIVLKGSA
jgi:hexosaminidase